MRRVRTGAHHGLRWCAFGFVVAALAVSSQSTQAAPYADIVVDANAGTILHATNPDARRHPASLTKIMTLYLLFERLEAGKLKLDSPLTVSQEAAAQAPTKLGLRPGTTIQVEDAIKGMVTRSANDAAVVVAEAIAGDEDEFAKLMTRKARVLGMTRTVYKNASGLPDDDQETTARDQATLGRAIQERFPRYYKYFSVRSFTFRGQSISNHNHLLGRVEGVDGIKTGYIGASGFNLVTSVHRGSRYIVAVVMGGSSAGSRDARMRELISEKLSAASTKRTAPMIAEAAEAPSAKSEPNVAAKIESKPIPKPQPKPEPNAAKPEPQFAVASANGVPTAAPAQPRVNPGSTDPIRPVLVKTVAVKAGTHAPSLAPLQVASLAASEPPAAQAAPAVLEAASVAAANPEPSPPPAASARPDAANTRPPRAGTVPPSPAPALFAKPHPRSGWMIQVGAYPAEQAAKQRLSAVQSKASKILTGADAFTEPVAKGGTTYYRARFAGLDKDRAEAACKYLKRNDVECVTIKN
jgi:D-alanyl-D-alanine carboxypeptidase